ncbi:hypothetical protein ICN83_01040 [Sphingopyxis granuli]|nr:hypothetical protein ICN83_01040 [Sphingopyxis granuli]
MKKIFNFITLWSQISFYGILGISAVILGFMLTEFFFGADFGYKLSDLLIVGGIAIFTAILFFLIKGIVGIARKR